MSEERPFKTLQEITAQTIMQEVVPNYFGNEFTGKFIARVGHKYSSYLVPVDSNLFTDDQIKAHFKIMVRDFCMRHDGAEKAQTAYEAMKGGADASRQVTETDTKTTSGTAGSTTTFAEGEVKETTTAKEKYNPVGTPSGKLSGETETDFDHTSDDDVTTVAGTTSGTESTNRSHNEHVVNAYGVDQWQALGKSSNMTSPLDRLVNDFGNMLYYPYEYDYIYGGDWM